MCVCVCVYVRIYKPGQSVRTMCSTFYLNLVAITAVQTLVLLYAWPPPGLSFLCFRCWASPLPMFRTFILSWFCMTSASSLHIFVIKS